MKGLIRQFLNFALVGGISTLIDFIVLYALHEMLGINYLVGTAIAFIVATVFNYWASMRYIFKSKYQEDQRGKEFSIFLILSIIGLILTQVLMVLFVESFGMEVMISKLFVTAFVMVFNFVSRKLTLDDSSDSKLDTEEPGKIVVKEESQYD